MISTNDINNITIKTENCTSEQEAKNGVQFIYVEFDDKDFKNYSLVDPHIILDEDKDDKGRDKNKK